MHQRTITEAITNYGTLRDHLLKENLDADSPEGERARAEIRNAIIGGEDARVQDTRRRAWLALRGFTDHRR